MVASGGTVSPSSAINQVANGFNDPAAVVVDVNGNIFVADYYNRAVEEIHSGGDCGRYACRLQHVDIDSCA